MSSPMFDLPGHWPVEVNAAGEGPECDRALVAGIECACGDPGCVKWRDDDAVEIVRGIARRFDAS